MEFIINLSDSGLQNSDFDSFDVKEKDTLTDKFSNKLAKMFRGIKILCKNYIIFIKGSTINVINLLNFSLHHWGIQMIMTLGFLQTYNQITQLSAVTNILLKQ